VTTISIRISEELKERMKEFADVNWSQYLREAIADRIREEEMRRACNMMDEIASKTSGEWSGAKEIRRWRDQRYGTRGS